MRDPVPVEQRVAVGIWWMANNMSYRAIGQQFGLARSTVAGIVIAVTHAIAEELLRRVVYLRNPDRREKAVLFDALEDWEGVPPPGERPPRFNLLRALWDQGGRPGWRHRTPTRRPRARRVQQAPAQVEEADGSPGERVVEQQEAGPIDVGSGPETPAQEDSAHGGESPRAVEEGATGGTPIVISSAVQTEAEGAPVSDPGEGPSAPPPTRRLDRLERDMAQLQVTVARCEQRVTTALERTVELSRLLTQLQLDDAVREQRREDLERQDRVAQPPVPHRGPVHGWRAVQEEGSGDADSEGTSAGGAEGSSEGGSEDASAQGLAEASTEEEAEGPNQAIPPDPEWDGVGVGEPETDSE
ncbi:UNVERIFIED_CONTAM: hypothetical protein K2H54_009693 [Gekko kuhli]